MRAPSPKQRRKASEYLWQDRVRVTRASRRDCEATVRGSDTYTVQMRDGRWECTCPLQQHRPSWACAHIAAAWLWWHAAFGEREDCDERSASPEDALAEAP